MNDQATIGSNRDQRLERPGLAWLLVSGLGGAIAAAIVAGVLLGRAGAPIHGTLLLAAGLLGALPRLLALLRARWEPRWPEGAAALAALAAVGGVGLALAWPSLLPLGRSVDAVHQYQLVSWIAEERRLPPLDPRTQGLMGEMIAYPPGLALTVTTVASALGRPTLDVLYPTVALLGGLCAALVALLAVSAGGARTWAAAGAALAGPLLLLAHRTYMMEAYVDHSYYAMALGMFLVLLACAWIAVEPRRSRWGDGQLGLALAALLATYPLWLPIPLGLALVARGRGTGDGRRETGDGRRETRRQGDRETGRQGEGVRNSKLLTQNFKFALQRSAFSVPRSALVLGPVLALGLIDLPARLATGQTVLSHEGLVTLPSLFSLTPILLALPAALALLLLRPARPNPHNQSSTSSPSSFVLRPSSFVLRLSSFSLQPSAFLVLAALLALGELAGLALAARAGLTAIYHSFKILFILTPLAAALVGAAGARLAATGRPARRAAVLAGLALVLALTSGRYVLPINQEQVPTADLVQATRWLRANSPVEAERAVTVNAPSGPLAYWVQVALLGQWRDEAGAAMQAFAVAPPTAEGWAVDLNLPEVVVAARLDEPPPGSEVLARFGQAAVLRRAPFDPVQVNPLILRYNTFWEDERLKTAIELLRQEPGPLPLVELRLLAGDTLVNRFELPPNPERVRNQYLGADVLPATLGGVGYVNSEAYPTFAPPAEPPAGPLALVLRLSVDGQPVDERLLATFDRTAAGQFANLAVHSGELDYLRRAPDEAGLRPATADVGGGLRLTGWSGPARASAGDTVELALRWQATEQVSRSLLLEIQVVGQDGRVAAYARDVPQRGFYPTWRWRPGEPVVERRVVDLPRDLPPGTYTVLVSAYDPQAGRPLAAAAPVGELVVE